MSRYTELRDSRPIRFFVAVTVFRALWWPAVALAMPFALIGGVVDWLSWTAFPFIARIAQPVWSAAHKGALAVGNAILGYRPETDNAR